MSLYLTAPISKCAVEFIITLPSVGKLGLIVTAIPSPSTGTVL